MLKNTVLFLLVAVVCASVPAYAKKAVKASNKVIVKKEVVPSPEWVYQDEVSVIKDKNGKAYLNLRIESTRDTMQMAEMDVKANKAILIAGLISQFTSVEMLSIDSGLQDEQGELKPYYSQIVTTISRNVDTHGLMPAGSYWEIWKVKENGQYKQVYRVVKLYTMPYEEFQKRLLQEITKEEPGINKELNMKSQDFLKKMERQLEKLAE